MAQIGVKFNNSTAGTDIAGDFIKALMGDPKDEAYLARTRSQIESDAVNRRATEQDILYRQALTAASQGEEARKAQDTLYDTQAVPYYSQMGVDAMGQPVPAPAPATEAPAIVLESGGRGLPEHLFNADPRHQAIEPPVPIEDLPMPPQLQGLPPELMPPELGAITQLGVQRGERGDLTESALPLGGLSPSAIPMPEQLAGVPPELAQAPPPAGPVVGAAADNPIVGRGDNPRLNNLLNIFGAGAEEEPVPVLPEDYYTPVAGLDLPEAQPGPVEGLPEPPVPVAEPGMVPMSDLPPPIDTTQTAAVPPETPVPVAEPGAPTSAAAEPVPPTPPPAAPAAAPTMPERSTLTIKGADDGKADTATTIQTTKAGPIPRAGVEAMVRSIMVGEGSPEGKMQAVQRLMGTLGATYNPQFGQKGQEGVTENLASLRQGGSAVGKDAQISQLTAPEGQGGYEGTAIDVQDNNTINAVMDPAAPVTPALARQYAQTYTRQFRTPRMQRIEDEDGNFRDVPVMPEVPAGTPSVAEVYARAGIAGEAPAAAPAGEAPAAAMPADAGGATTGGTVTGGATTTTSGTPQTDADGFVVKRPKETPTADVLQNQRYHDAVVLGDQELNSLTDEDIPTLAEYLGSNPTKANASILREVVNQTFRYNNPKLAKYWGAAMQFASPVLRDESGAATRPEDMDIVLERYIRAPNDSPEVVARKALRRKVVAEGLKSGAFPGNNPRERLAAADAHIVKMLGEEALLDHKYKTGETTTPAGGTAAPALTAPTGALPEGVSEDDIAETMRANGMTRQQVLDALAKQNQGENNAGS